MNNTYKAAIYCRLSKDDEQSGDSISIETQKMMLTKYCIEHNIEIFDIYVDDGYSGLNFNRPSFKRLIEDLEYGKFNAVITKDLSRLGRDYIQTGYYIDIYFTSKQVRYIAINDGIDTEHENNDIAPFKNILNDMYAKDLSRKIKSAKQQRAQNGFYISAQPPYGYKVNPYNRNQLIVDHAVAPVVKFIFELAEQGKSFSEISRILEAEKYISPSAYKVINGDTRFLKYTKAQTQIYKWSYQTVRAILNNRVYVGDMVNHKIEVINYKTKERVRIPPEKQIIVPNTHEALIERERFEKISTRVSKRREPNHKYKNSFKGILFCSECGAELQLISKKSKYECKPMFRCFQHFMDKNICSHNHHIYYDELFDEVKKQLGILIEEYVSSDEYKMLCKTVFDFISFQFSEKRMSLIQNDLSTVNKQIKDCYKRLSLNAERTFKSNELNDLLERQKSLILKIGEINTSSSHFTNNDLMMSEIMLTVKDYLRDIVLNENNIKHLIKRIEIGHLEKGIDGMEQKITLHYKF